MPQTNDSHIWSSCVQPVFTYMVLRPGTEQKETSKNCKTPKTVMERSMIGMHKTEKIRNSDIKRKTNLINIRYTIKKLKWKFGGNVVWYTSDGWEKKTLAWRRMKGKGTGTTSNTMKGRILKIIGANKEKDGCQPSDLEKEAGGVCPNLGSVSTWQEGICPLLPLNYRVKLKNCNKSLYRLAYK